MAPPRAAIVGAGLMGSWHADALHRAGAQLALVVDRDAGRARTLAARYAGCQQAASLDALALAKVDVVHVCTPTSSHESLVRAALDGGCHVLVEKPLAATRATTCALLELAQAHERLLCPVHQILFQRGVQQVLAARDRIQPLHVDIVLCSAGAENSRVTPDELMAEILPHPISFLLALVPVDASRGEWRADHPSPGEFRATLRLPDLTASILVSAHGRPTVNGARVIGRGGTVHLDFFHGFAVFQSARVSRPRKIAQPFLFSAALGSTTLVNLAGRAVRREPAYPGLRTLVARFYHAARTGQPAPIPPADIISVAAIRDALLGGG